MAGYFSKQIKYSLLKESYFYVKYSFSENLLKFILKSLEKKTLFTKHYYISLF